MCNDPKDKTKADQSPCLSKVEKLVSHVLMMPGAEGCWSERRGKEGLGDGWDGCWVDGTVHDEKYACEARPVGRRLTLGLVPI